MSISPQLGLLALALSVLTTLVSSEQLRTAQRELPPAKAAAAALKPLLTRKALKKAQLASARQPLQENFPAGIGQTFDPNRDDEDWPGAFASREEELILNIREDDFPDEIRVAMRVVFSLLNAHGGTTTSPPLEWTMEDLTAFATSSTSTSKQGAFSSPMERRLISLPVTFFNQTETLYQVEVVDLLGDGICCGAYGNGWITLTDHSKNILWSAVGNYTHVATAYLWRDVTGHLQLVATTDPVLALLGQNTTTTSASTTLEDFDSTPCMLCPLGATTMTPSKTLPWGDDDTITCADLEEVYQYGLTTAQCIDLDRGGFTQYYRARCNCPTYAPTCPLCQGQSVQRPNSIMRNINHDGETDLTCWDLEFFFMRLSETECDTWQTDTLKSMEDFCGCPASTQQP